MSGERVPFITNENENIIRKSIVTFIVPDREHIGLGIVVDKDADKNTYTVRYIADNELLNIIPYRPETIITSNTRYNFKEKDITNTKKLYKYDNITDENLITNLEALRKLLNPKTLKRLEDYRKLPDANTRASQSYTQADPSYKDDGLNPALLAVNGGYSAKSIRRRRKSRRHKKSNNRHKKSNNRNKKSNRRR